MNYLKFLTRKYRHISSNANGNNILDMLNIPLKISRKTLAIIVRKAGFINQIENNILINKNNILMFINKRFIR